ncbi:hypothetical protein TcasGA2_TC034785 [Tribolium castaneum]|uniref:Uncharacterized protein n=1 Tax=Tribolium castaneum TaxID=7070 RepID=A0A139WFD5_TRICA|nr:hypothetical protein TcasGA2_TC034785 [Tribolium castaneum]
MGYCANCYEYLQIAFRIRRQCFPGLRNLAGTTKHFHKYS